MSQGNLILTVHTYTDYGESVEEVTLYAEDVVTLLIDNPDAMERLVEAIDDLTARISRRLATS